MNLEDFPEVPAHVRMIVWLGLEKHQEAWSNREQTEGDFCVYAETVNTTDSRRILVINNRRSEMGPDSRSVIFLGVGGGGTRRKGRGRRKLCRSFYPRKRTDSFRPLRISSLGFQTQSRILILITRYPTRFFEPGTSLEIRIWVLVSRLHSSTYSDWVFVVRCAKI